LKKDITTEEKIKSAAEKVFTKKGFAATRTRDIAEESGLNLSLLNYYFRSKQKLFDIVMLEKVQKFFGVLAPILYNGSTTLENKVENIASQYIDLVLANPELPLFIMSEMRNSPEVFVKVMERPDFLINSEFIKQIKKRRPDIHPLHFLFSILGMCIFPFLMKPALQIMVNVKDDAFIKMMKERKKLIPIWTKNILGAK